MAHILIHFIVKNNDYNNFRGYIEVGERYAISTTNFHK